MLTYLWVALGGALGSAARAAVGGWAARAFGDTFPWGTLGINVGGSLVIGLFAALTAPGGPLPGSPDLRAFVMVGLCGGFTTFSAFSLQTLELVQAGEGARAALYVLLSVAACVAATALGAWLGGRAGS